MKVRSLNVQGDPRPSVERKVMTLACQIGSMCSGTIALPNAEYRSLFLLRYDTSLQEARALVFKLMLSVVASTSDEMSDGESGKLHRQRSKNTIQKMEEERILWYPRNSFV